jgi:hypothetical protein
MLGQVTLVHDRDSNPGDVKRVHHRYDAIEVNRCAFPHSWVRRMVANQATCWLRVGNGRSAYPTTTCAPIGAESATHRVDIVTLIARSYRRFGGAGKSGQGLESMGRTDPADLGVRNPRDVSIGDGICGGDRVWRGMVEMGLE